MWSLLRHLRCVSKIAALLLLLFFNEHFTVSFSLFRSTSVKRFALCLTPRRIIIMWMLEQLSAFSAVSTLFTHCTSECHIFSSTSRSHCLVMSCRLLTKCRNVVCRKNSIPKRLSLQCPPPSNFSKPLNLHSLIEERIKRGRRELFPLFENPRSRSWTPRSTSRTPLQGNCSLHGLLIILHSHNYL